MLLQELYLKNFKGIKEKELKFVEGLNIIFGPNEAGKSSIFQAVALSLFGDAASKKAELKNYFYRLKHPPYIKLKFKLKNKEFQLERDFVNHQQALTLPTGEILKHKDEISKTIFEELGLQFSPGSTENLKTRFEDLFLIHQERVEISSPEDLIRLLLETSLKNLKVRPEQAASRLKELHTALYRGVERAAKNKGLIAILTEKKLKLEQELKELQQKLNDYKADLIELEEKSKQLLPLKSEIERLESLEQAFKNIKDLAQKAEKAFEELGRLEAARKLKEAEEALKNGYPAYFLLMQVRSALDRLKFEEKAEHLFKEIEELKTLEEEKELLTAQLKEVPPSVEKDYALADLLEKIRSKAEELLSLEKELSHYQQDLLKDLKQAQKLAAETEAGGTTFNAKAKLEIDTGALQKFIIRADDKEITAASSLEFDFENSLSVTHPEFKAIISINSSAAEKRAASKKRLDEILKKHGAGSLDQLEQIADEFSRKIQKHSLLKDEIKKQTEALKDGKLKSALQSAAEKGARPLLQAINQLLSLLLESYAAGKVDDLKDRLDKRRQLENDIARLEQKLKEKGNRLQSLAGRVDTGVLQSMFAEFSRPIQKVSQLLDEARIDEFGKLLKFFSVSNGHPHEHTLPVREEAAFKPEYAALLKQLGLSDQEINIVSALPSEAFADEVKSSAALLEQALSAAAAILNELRANFSEKELQSLKNIKSDFSSLNELIKDQRNKYRRSDMRLQVEVEALQEIIDPKYPDYGFLAEIETLADSFENRDYDQLFQKSDDMVKKIEALLKKIRPKLHELEKEIVRLEQKTSLVPDATEIDRRKNLLDAIDRKLEKAWLAARALQLAVESFEPALGNFASSIIRKAAAEASEVFSRLTGESYPIIEIKTKDSGEISLEAYNSLLEMKLEPGLLSQGTFDQLYLALRIGFSRQVFEKFSFPFFFDETFADFDDNRLINAVKLLCEFLNEGKPGQIFITTCQERVLVSILKTAESYGLKSKVIKFE